MIAKLMIKDLLKKLQLFQYVQVMVYVILS